MAETLSKLSLISFIVAGAAFVITLFLWIIFKIPKVISDLSGRTARKSIAKMRESNEKSGNKSYRTSKENAKRGKLTGKIPDSGGLGMTERMGKKAGEEMPETGLLSSNKARKTAVEQTALLIDNGEDGLLAGSGETQLLYEPVVSGKRTGGKKLTMLDDVMLIHTDEVIE